MTTKTTTEQRYEYLRGLTSDCMFWGTKRIGAQHPNDCEKCQGSGTVPKHKWLWEDCFGGRHVDADLNPDAFRHDTCPLCKGARLIHRTPTPGEVEMALFEVVRYEIYKHGGEVHLVSLYHKSLTPAGHVKGTDPDACRLKALCRLQGME